MGTIPSGTIDAAHTYFQTLIKGRETEMQPPQYKKIAMETRSMGPTETYEWLRNLVSVRKWEGGRLIQSMKGESITIRNDLYEATVGVAGTILEDDRLGLIAPQIQSLPDTWVEFREQKVFEMLVAGFTELAFTGKAFFATDHPFGSNKGTKKLSASEFGKALAQVMALKWADTGARLRVVPTILVVGPSQMSVAEDILLVDSLSAGGRNKYYKRAELIVSPEIEDDKWFLIDGRKALKPVIVQERSAMGFRWIEGKKPLEAEDEGQYGANERVGFGYGVPWLAFGSTGASS